LETWQFLVTRSDQFLALTLRHIEIVGLSVLIAVVVGVLIGIYMTYNEYVAQVMLALAGVIMTIPGIAMLAMLIPLLGIGLVPAITALVLYGQLPILRNTYTGIKEVPAAMLEAGRGMGMTEGQLMWRVKLPLALPVIIAGVRTSIVMNVGLAALAAAIGAGGLGKYIFQGIARTYNPMVLTGAIGVSIIAIALDIILQRVENRLISAGLGSSSEVAQG
jgi:osmoprotectant transport system permease protein